MTALKKGSIVANFFSIFTATSDVTREVVQTVTNNAIKDRSLGLRVWNPVVMRCEYKLRLYEE